MKNRKVKNRKKRMKKKKEKKKRRMRMRRVLSTGQAAPATALLVAKTPSRTLPPRRNLVRHTHTHTHTHTRTHTHTHARTHTRTHAHTPVLLRCLLVVDRLFHLLARVYFLHNSLPCATPLPPLLATVCLCHIIYHAQEVNE